MSEHSLSAFNPASAGRILTGMATIRRDLWSKGYRPVAVSSFDAQTGKSDGKRPEGNAWINRALQDPPEAAVRAVDPYSVNTGILANGLRAIDLDVNDRDWADCVEALAILHFGSAPVRERGNSARRLLVYRAADGEPPKRSITSFDAITKVEILGAGQQFVAFGVHPSGGGTAYRWRVPLPPRADLVSVTEDQVTAFLRDACAVIKAPPEKRTPVSTVPAPAHDGVPAVQLEVVEAILRQTPNGPEFSDRNSWVKMAHAIAATFESDPDRGRESWLGWCDRWTEGVPDADEALRVWESLDGEHRTDVRSILRAARSAGVDLARCGYVEPPLRLDARDEFEVTGEGAVATLQPELRVRQSNLAATALDLGEHLRRLPDLFERVGGEPVAIDIDPAGVPSIRDVGVDAITFLAHQACVPFTVDRKGNATPVTLPDKVAKIWLASPKCRRLRVFRGIAAAPLLTDIGGVRTPDGFDALSGMWCLRQPTIPLPEVPSRADAEGALTTLRQVLGGFPFADSVRQRDAAGIDRIDLHTAPGHDETAALVALMTAICRPSLDLAPGCLVAAPAITGSGAGKGLLVRVIAAIAYAAVPHAVAPGHKIAETEAKITGELLAARPVLMIDNINAQAFSSDLLASALTEQEIAVRPLGTSKMVTVAPRAWVVLTGNGLRAGEDLARRFVTVNLDAGVEDAESRPFEPGYLNAVMARRTELLAAALTIWRWGRQHTSLPCGASLGSFETWARWVRDPLLALGCVDPVERIRTAKSADPRRQRSLEILQTWFEDHGAAAVGTKDLSERVRALLAPATGSRQAVAHAALQLAGQRIGGFACVALPKSAKWPGAMYRVTRDETVEVEPLFDPPIKGAEFFEATMH